MKDLLITGINISDEKMQTMLSKAFNIEDTHDRKFIETKRINDYEILTDKGWVNIETIGKTIPYDIWYIKTENYYLKCADKHLVFDEDYQTMYVENLKVGMKIQTETGLEDIKIVYRTTEMISMYDLQLDNDSDKRYYTNGILSHNSMWMQNMAVKIADQGANVVYITLEMGSQKCMKRMGAMRMKIPIDDYDEKSRDTTYMKNKINQLKNMSTGLFSETPGKIFVKKYPTKMCTVTDIDNYISNFEQKKGIKINAVFVDYISLMGIEKGMNIDNNLFLKGKHLAEGLRYIADKHNLVMITATQTDKDVWGANDMDLKNMPESKAIAETADSVWAIIRNPEMQKNNLFRLKILKLRDGEHANEQVAFNINSKFLNMENDKLYVK